MNVQKTLREVHVVTSQDPDHGYQVEIFIPRQVLNPHSISHRSGNILEEAVSYHLIDTAQITG